MSKLSTVLSTLRVRAIALPLLALASSLTLASACDTADDDYALRVAQVEEAQDMSQAFHIEHDQCIEELHGCSPEDLECRASFEACAPEEGLFGEDRGDEDREKGEKGERPKGDELPPHCRPPKREKGEEGERPEGERPDADGERPEKPEQDGEKLEQDGEKPPRPEGEEGERPEGERPPLECVPLRELMHGAVKSCRGEMAACMETGELDHHGCALETRDCVADALTELFGQLCEIHLDACASEDAPAEKCEKLSARCEEGVLPPELELPELPMPPKDGQPQDGEPQDVPPED